MFGSRYYCVFGLCLILQENALQFKRNILIEHRVQWVIRHGERVIFSVVVGCFFLLSLLFISPSSLAFVVETATQRTMNQSWFSHHSIFHSTIPWVASKRQRKTNRRQTKKCLKNRRYNGSQLKVQQMNFSNKWNRPNSVFHYLKVTPAHSWTHTYTTLSYKAGLKKNIEGTHGTNGKWVKTILFHISYV